MSILIERTQPDESPSTLLGIALAAFMVYLLVPGVYLALAEKSQTAASQSTSQPVSEVAPHDEVVVSIAAPIVGFAVLVLGNLLFRRGAFERLGFKLGRLIPSGLLWGLLAAVIVLPMILITNILTQKFWDAIHFAHPNEHELLHILGDETSIAMRVAIVVSAVMLAPLFEEFFFRGMLQSVFKEILSGTSETARRWGAILMASAMFTAIHLHLWMMPPIFVLSVCLGYVYDRTKNLWVPIIVHASFNAVSVAMFLFLR